MGLGWALRVLAPHPVPSFWYRDRTGEYMVLKVIVLDKTYMRY